MVNIVFKEIVAQSINVQYMLVKQSQNTFIRTTDRYGYITNQLTRYDRSYNETGADYLKQISREPQDVEDIVDRLMQVYANANRDELREDFIGFITDLASDHFLVIGETVEELDANDQSFTYAIDNPKTFAVDFTQETKEKVSENTQDFFLEEVQGRPLISSLQFELSSRCNERCIHCYIPNGKKNEGFDMPLQKVKSILDEFADMGGLHVTLSGGEAFLHKDLMEICRYCREKDLKISILSNLISLKEEQIPTLKEVNLSLIQTSLYSMDPAIHDFITTVPGSHAKTKAAIELLVKNDIPVQISCPIMKANRKGYAEVLEYAKGLKIKAQTDYIMMAQADFDTNNLANRISIEETEELLRDIKQYSRSSEHDHGRDCGFFRVCHFGEKHIQEWRCERNQGTGRSSPADFCKGKLRKSPKVKELRKITQASFPQCLECEARDYCARCLVRNYNESGGDMFKINEHFCKVAFLNKRLIEEYRSKGLLK